MTIVVVVVFSAGVFYIISDVEEHVELLRW